MHKVFDWNWTDAIRCELCALPVILLTILLEPKAGLAWAVGILPVASIGMAPSRKARAKLLLVGVLFALCLILGALLTFNTLTILVGIFLVCYGSAILASHKPIGFIIMTLCVPLIGVGLSFGTLNEAMKAGLVICAGSVFSYFIFLLWPEYPAAQKAKPPKLLLKAAARQYGILLGLAGTLAAIIGVATSADHIGWPTAAALFVMRPSQDLQRWRSLGRVLSVAIGAVAAVVFVGLNPPPLVLGVTAVTALAVAGGVHKSKWYIMPAFSTFIVLNMLLYANTVDSTVKWRFNERVGETLLGVAVAYICGIGVPRITQLIQQRSKS